MHLFRKSRNSMAAKTGCIVNLMFTDVLVFVSLKMKHQHSDVLCLFSLLSPQAQIVFKGMLSQHPKSPSFPPSMVPRPTAQVSIVLLQTCVLNSTFAD